jgi:DUF971 family protein
MSDRLLPVNIAVIGGEIAIAWNDGGESYISIRSIREACPCAGCCGEPDALGRVAKPEVKHGPGSFELRGWQIVGGYAFQPSWGDGHATGLYTFAYLRKLAGGE